MGEQVQLGLFPQWPPIRELAPQRLGGPGPVGLLPGLAHLPRSTCCWDGLIAAHPFGVAEGGPPAPRSLSFVVPARRSSFMAPVPSFGKQLGNV